MTDEFKLNDRAKLWIAGIKNNFIGDTPTNMTFAQNTIAEIGGFKLM
jgi:hypothetical protein